MMDWRLFVWNRRKLSVIDMLICFVCVVLGKFSSCKYWLFLEFVGFFWKLLSGVFNVVNLRYGLDECCK